MARKAIKVVFFILLNSIVILAVVETGLWIYTGFKPIYDLEMQKYATHLKRPGSIPGLSHEHIPNSEALLMGVDFKINSQGFRNAELPETKASNEYRVMVLGCSNTVGWGVTSDSVFTALLEKKLNQNPTKRIYRVVNAGVGNYNTRLESIQLREKINVVQPDMVIVHYYINDAEVISPVHPGFLLRYSCLATLAKARSKYHAFEKAFKNIGSYYLQLYSDTSVGWKDAQKAMLDIKEVCSKNSVKLLVALQPDLHDLSKNSGQYKCHQILKEFMIKNQISCIDLMDAYRAKGGSVPEKFWVAKDDPHPNISGHRLIFEALLPIMEDSIFGKKSIQ